MDNHDHPDPGNGRCGASADLVDELVGGDVMITIGEERRSCNACGNNDNDNDAREIVFGFNKMGLTVSLCRKCRKHAIVILKAMGVDEDG